MTCMNVTLFTSIIATLVTESNEARTSNFKKCRDMSTVKPLCIISPKLPAPLNSVNVVSERKKAVCCYSITYYRIISPNRVNLLSSLLLSSSFTILRQVPEIFI